MEKKSDLDENIKSAWQKAQDAWVAAGKTIPCYEANYMKAREELSEAYHEAGYEQGKIKTKRTQRLLDHVLMLRWKPAKSAPIDGTHFLAANGPYSKGWGFNQSPPMVVHYWGNAGEEGFYLSRGIVENSYNDQPVEFTHWSPLGREPEGKVE